MINIIQLKDAERICRIAMILILITAGTSKFFSTGGFFDYYSGLFQGELRIQLPSAVVNAYLALIPYLEIALGIALLSNKFKWLAVHGWFAFMLSLMVGHYILQEFSAVNQMIDYLFLGVLCLVLPRHESWFRRDTQELR